MRRFYVPPNDFRNSEAVLGAEETRHLRDVLRLRAGDEVHVFDGRGREFAAVIETIGKKETILHLAGEVAPTAPVSGLDLTLAVALLKGEKFDFVVQKAVELGVGKFVPLMTRRADVKLKAAVDFAKKRERLERIALEACKQSGRADLMSIGELARFEDFIEKSGNETVVMFAERGGETLEAIAPSSKIIAVVGPEGGWEDAEIDFARRSRAQVVTLGGRILRAETAAVAVAAVLQHRFGDLN